MLVAYVIHSTLTLLAPPDILALTPEKRPWDARVEPVPAGDLAIRLDADCILSSSCGVRTG